MPPPYSGNILADLLDQQREDDRREEEIETDYEIYE